MPVNVDIVILSYAKTDELKQITIQGIDSLIRSENQAEIKFNVLVIESEKNLQPYQYTNTETIYPVEKFGFNKYLNIGAKQTSSPYICFCNNDLVFHKNWASEILKAMDNDAHLLSATPYCSTFHEENGFAQNGPPVEGYFGVFVGWCFFVKREIFDIIGPFDEKFTFWYSDGDYCQNLLKHGVKNALVPQSLVTHLGSESLKRADEREQQMLTQLPRFYYGYKWLNHSWVRYQLQTLLFKLRQSVGK